MVALEFYADNPVLSQECKFPVDELLTIELIRDHTKTDDVPSVSDEQLKLYRAASVEAAEQYTGIMLRGYKPITEQIDFRIGHKSMRSGYVVYNLHHPSTDGIVYLYGALTTTLRIRPRSRKIHIPTMAIMLDVSSACCRGPCDEFNERGGHVQFDLMALYRTGFAKWDDLPKGIILGMLKFIAWCVTHPGDELISVRNKEGISAGLIMGTNNVAFASGALELWRQYDSVA
ncbi:hypothetical protein RB623_06800 [Mesorhizobium sp. LHD-90]|uniref:hypothetical protein n=1 Tax=Mesorhizobium sp. LHD-90 TaxID=3071414 RepID=UPI0027DF902C|nr:hypothetical protein [Mesorhizobium sp. LHD-90]MDQ6433759.1 hypothetical protein [Mesorhizobium sp. LHD-90]